MFLSTSGYQPSFFDESDRLERLTKLQDPLVALVKHLDFEIFRPKLAEVFTKEKKSPADRKPFDVVFMFQILILQRIYNLSDEQVEFQINDRHSFQRFLGLRMGSKVPDFSTVWLFRDALTKEEAIKPLFDVFGATLEARGVITKAGAIVDASFVEVPRQRNTRQDNETIKQGGYPKIGQRSHPSSARKAWMQGGRGKLGYLLRVQEPCASGYGFAFDHRLRCHGCVGACFAGLAGIDGRGEPG